MARSLTFGIDPGLTGAVATLIDGVPGPILDMPTFDVGGWGEVDCRAVVVFIRGVRGQHADAVVSACIEKVGARPGDGGTSAFRFGQTAGKLQAVLEVLGIPTTRVVPAQWKRTFGLLKKEKEASRQLARSRYPSARGDLTLKKHADRAEALLIALWFENTHLASHITDEASA
ncbi:hypothetical protein [Stenotrophomonas geniculata]|uniref:hypothetical protein n=1 Tax=Stenotrophomonas geniculata TaxID=86188 RepID=UPI002479CD73|nr:hypothetical protein [Stenotrophomonas geniculata]MDH7548253.1 hypothetical protein [Stenotrophomonas geniculata]